MSTNMHMSAPGAALATESCGPADAGADPHGTTARPRLDEQGIQPLPRGHPGGGRAGLSGEPRLARELCHAATTMPERVRPDAWWILRGCGLAGALGLAVAGLLTPPAALTLFWGLFVPLAPLVFLIAPGLWRNVCPLATLNQLPRRFGFGRDWTLPGRAQRLAPLISASLFLFIVPLRKVLLDHNGSALSIFVLVVLALAFVGGLCFKGKSGWCTQVCPMLPLERLYGQSPLLVVRDRHCRPCVGCTKNCYDVKPLTASLADLHDRDPRLRSNRALVAGALPWLIIAFFTQPYLTALTALHIALLYVRLLLFVAIGTGTFRAIDQLTPLSIQQIILGHVVAAVNLYYWFVTPLILHHFLGADPLVVHLAQAGIAILSLVWLWRALLRERLYLGQRAGSANSPRGRLHPMSPSQKSK